MQCPRCGQEMDNTTTQCPHCASAAPQQPLLPPPPMFNPTMPVDDSAPLKTNGLAIASLVISIVGMCCGGGLIGIILGIVALNQIKDPRNRQTGSGLAIGGIAVSAFSIVVLIPIMAAVLFPVFSKAREKARQTTCMSQVRQLATACQMYAQDNNGKSPPADGWDKSLLPYLGDNARILHCPSMGTDLTKPVSYVYNPKLSGVKDSSITNPFTTPIIWCTSNHSGGMIIGFADGHVKYCRGVTSIEEYNPAAETPDDEDD